MIRTSNPYVLTPAKLPRFSGMHGKRQRVLEVRDSEGRPIADKFANWQCDLDSCKYNGMTLRHGKQKVDTTGHAGTVQWIGNLRFRGKMFLAYQVGGYLKVDADWQIPSPWFPDDTGSSSGGGVDVGLPDFFAVSDGENDMIIYCSPDFSTWDRLGSTGAGVNQFNGPRHCWYDQTSAYFYVADAGNNRIVKTQIDGTGWTTKSGTIGGVAIDYPYGIWYDGSQYVYFTNRDTNSVMRWDFTGGAGGVFTALAGVTPTTLGRPRGVFGSGSKVYIADDDNSRIVECDWGGGNAVALGTLGSGDYQFTVPRSVYVDSATDFVYVSDRDNNRIVRTRMDGSCWAELAGFSQPRGVFFDTTSQYLFTADTEANTLRREDIFGDGGVTFGRNGDGTKAGFFGGPRYVQPIWV